MDREEEEKEVPVDIDREAQEVDMVREVHDHQEHREHQDRHARIIMRRVRTVTDRHHHQDHTIIITDRRAEVHLVLLWQHFSLC